MCTGGVRKGLSALVINALLRWGSDEQQRTWLPRLAPGGRAVTRRDGIMAAMKPRTGDGPLEVVKEGRGIVLRMPLEGGGRLVVEMTPDEVRALGQAIDSCEGLK